MLTCFKCQKCFKNVDEYLRHLKIFHFLTNTDSKTCAFNNCKASFSRFSSLKRHLLQHEPNDGEPAPKTAKIQQSSGIEKILIETNSSDKSQEQYKHIDNNSKNENGFLAKSLELNLLDLASSLYSKNSFSRKDATSILNKFKYILQSTFNHLQESKLLTLELTNSLQLPLKPYTSEFKFTKSLKEADLFNESEAVILSNEIGEIVSKGNPTLGPKIKCLQIMPIEFQIRKFFELPNVLNTMEDNLSILKENKLICNLINGEVMQNYINDADIVFTYNLYFDDFQVNNALGTHTHSICACYYSFPTLPQFLQSKLDFIFPALFCDSNYLKTYGPEICFKPLVNVLKRLEDGIIIDSKRVSFVLGLIVGDNLAVNTVLGLTQSFNSIRFCRYCREEKNDTRKGTFETNFRTLNN